MQRPSAGSDTSRSDGSPRSAQDRQRRPRHAVVSAARGLVAGGAGWLARSVGALGPDALVARRGGAVAARRGRRRRRSVRRPGAGGRRGRIARLSSGRTPRRRNRSAPRRRARYSPRQRRSRSRWRGASRVRRRAEPGAAVAFALGVGCGGRRRRAPGPAGEVSDHRGDDHQPGDGDQDPRIEAGRRRFPDPEARRSRAIRRAGRSRPRAAHRATKAEEAPAPAPARPLRRSSAARRRAEPRRTPPRPGSSGSGTRSDPGEARRGCGGEAVGDRARRRSLGSA